MLVDHDGVRLRVEVHGTGSPVGVWAHGLTSSVEEIEPFSAATPGTRVLYDLRGHGGSDAPASGYGYEDLLRDLRFVADRFAATYAFGVSVSAETLVLLAAREPQRFERLVLMIPGALDEPNAGAAHFADVARDLESMPADVYAERCLSDPVYGLLFRKRPHWRPLVRERLSRLNATGVPRSLRSYVGADPPLRDPTPLRNVDVPVLIVAHEDDPVHDVKVARRIAELLPKATLEVWPEPLAMLDDVDAFARRVARFLTVS